VSQDGIGWEDLKETVTTDERRTFRIHRLDQRRRVRWVRLAIHGAAGAFPTLREVEFFADSRAEIAFPPWAVVVSTTGSADLPGEGSAAFRRLARSCDSGKELQFQNIWLGDFHERFAEAEPRPLCAFLSGNFMESHCGQIEWAPRGWELIATLGEGGKTKTQCLRLKERLVYAAQFHIEMDGTPDSSRTIMSNFLALCRHSAGR
jgi:hypothetical protein